MRVKDFGIGGSDLCGNFLNELGNLFAGLSDSFVKAENFGFDVVNLVAGQIDFFLKENKRLSARNARRATDALKPIFRFACRLVHENNDKSPSFPAQALL